MNRELVVARICMAGGSNRSLEAANQPATGGRDGEGGSIGRGEILACQKNLRIGGGVVPISGEI